jgi:hypothetical protein
MILFLILLAYWLLSIYCLFVAIKNRDNLKLYNPGWSNFVRSMVCLIFAKLIFTALTIITVRRYMMNIDNKRIKVFQDVLESDIKESNKILKENINETFRAIMLNKTNYQISLLETFKRIFQ